MPLPVCLDLILLAASGPSGAVIVRGDSDCPSPSAPDDVELRRHDGALEESSHELPSFEALLGLGLSFGPNP
jgi:hypothetical protein